jgi:hypothetical protein
MPIANNRRQIFDLLTGRATLQATDVPPAPAAYIMNVPIAPTRLKVEKQIMNGVPRRVWPDPVFNEMQKAGEQTDRLYREFLKIPQEDQGAREAVNKKLEQWRQYIDQLGY